MIIIFYRIEYWYVLHVLYYHINACICVMYVFTATCTLGCRVALFARVFDKMLRVLIL